MQEYGQTRSILVSIRSVSKANMTYGKQNSIVNDYSAEDNITRSQSAIPVINLCPTENPDFHTPVRLDDYEHALELTCNWDPEDYGGGRNFGHLTYEVDDIYATCQRLIDRGVTINRPPPAP